MAKKIFKYNYNRETGQVFMPKNARVIRTDHVDDGFVEKGDYLWGIVDPEDPKVERKFTCFFPYSESPPLPETLRSFRIQLKIKEKQEVEVPGLPCFVEEEDGEIYLYYIPKALKPKTFKIAFFKTGQPIDIDLSTARYLGLGRIWIIQELGLYCFQYEELV